MSEESRMFYKHIKKQLKKIPNTSVAERLKKHILAHPDFNSSRHFLDLVVANYCTNRKKDRLPSKEIIRWLSQFLDVEYKKI